MLESNTDIENKVINALKKVIDPELNIDIVNLGLIYDVKVDENQICTIKMTLTTMGCPLSDLLNDQITKAVTKIDGIKKCAINLVWYPAWDASKITSEGKEILGIHI